LVCKQGKDVDQRIKSDVIGEAAKLICPFSYKGLPTNAYQDERFFLVRFTKGLGPLWNKGKSIELNSMKFFWITMGRMEFRNFREKH
jgi:hypothetical protein